MRNEKLRRLIGAVAAAAIVPLTPAAAQEGESVKPSALEVITVTARKVEERLLDVPVSINAFTAAEIERAGIRDLNDVAALTPGLTLSNSFGEMLPTPVIRGVAPTDIFGENNAAIFVDGVYISGREGLNFSQLDLERIEVVKGPQAALYGRNAFSGAINYVTARPTDEFEGKAEATLGSDDLRSASVALSGPLVEGTLKGRLAVQWDDFDGTYDNRIADGPDIGGHEYKTAQAALYFTPTETFDALLSVYVSDDHIDAPAHSSLSANCENRRQTNPALSSRDLNFCGELTSIDKDSIAIVPGATGEEREAQRATLNLNFDLAAGDITALSGYSKVEQEFVEDGGRGDGENDLYIYVPTAPVLFVAGPLGPVSPMREFRSGQLQTFPGVETTEFSQELRFTSRKDRAVRYSIGGYYYDVKRESAYQGLTATQPLPADFRGFCPCAQLRPPNPAMPLGAGASLGFGTAALLPMFTTSSLIDSVVTTNETQSWAAFGWMEVDLGSRVTARGEVRYTEDDKSVNDIVATIRNGLPPVELEQTWDYVTWRGSVDYKPTDDSTLYVSVGHAEKGGGLEVVPDVVLTPAPGAGIPAVATGSFDPEKITTTELGYKASFLDGRLRTDVAAFYSDWSDIVIPQVYEDLNGVPVAQPYAMGENAGDATVMGLELGVDFRLSERITGSVRGSIQDAEFDDAKIGTFELFPSFAPDGDVSGNKLLRQSREQGSVSLTYTQPFGGESSGYVRTDVSYQGKQYADATNQVLVPDRTLVNLRLGFERNAYEIELWARNLLDDDTPTGAFREIYFANATPEGTYGAGTLYPIRWTVSHPLRRQFGVTFRARF